MFRCIFVIEKFCTLSSTGLDNGLAPNRWQAITWTDAEPIHWRTYAAPGGDELINVSLAVNDFEYDSVDGHI